MGIDLKNDLEKFIENSTTPKNTNILLNNVKVSDNK